MKPWIISSAAGIIKLLRAVVVCSAFNNLSGRISSFLRRLWSRALFNIGIKASDIELEDLVSNPEISPEHANKLLTKPVIDKKADVNVGEDEWDNLTREFLGDEDSVKKLRNIIATFLKPDHIDPVKFQINWIALRQCDPSPLFENFEKHNPSPSIEKFASADNRPLAYRKWFLAAYPDVVSWAADIANTREIENLVSNMSEDDFLSDKGFSDKQLRKLIDKYLKKTGLSLECSQ